MGGLAALFAAVIFRRNIGAEVSLFSHYTFPETVIDWFLLLQNNRFVGLSYLNLFDAIDYALLGFMFLALYWALRTVDKGTMVMATALGLMGAAVSLASNSALSMLALSNQYSSATTESQKAMLLAAGQAMLAISNRPGVISQSTGVYTSFLLIALAGLFTSFVMLRSAVFPRLCSFLGILAGSLDLIYCAAVVIVPVNVAQVVGLGTMPLAGLLLTIWHFWIGWKLIKLAIGK